MRTARDRRRGAGTASAVGTGHISACPGVGPAWGTKNDEARRKGRAIVTRLDCQREILAHPEGLEPPTPRFVGWRLGRLNGRNEGLSRNISDFQRSRHPAIPLRAPRCPSASPWGWRGADGTV
jgi:hypothetical protein